MEEIEKLIEKIKEENNIYGEHLQPPADIEDNHSLKLRVQDMFGFRLDSVYLNILEITDGIDYDGTVLYASKTNTLVGYEDRFIDGFIEANEIWHEDSYKKSFLIYAESDMYLFFQTMEDYKFYIVPRDSLDTIVYQTSDSVDFFKKILESCLGDYVE